MIKIIVSGTLSIAALFFGSRSLETIPAVGPLMSPYHGFAQNAESRPSTDHIEIKISGVTESVKVVMDNRLVPHIYASNLADAYRIQGYLHAKYRLWQMDLTNRSTLGRLSEVLGERTIEYDKRQRRIGLPHAAKNAFKHWQDDRKVMKLMNAYTEGVNSYIKNLKPKNYPLEYKLLGYKPELFTPFNSAVLAISMANVLCSGNQDVELSNSQALLPKEDFDDLFPFYNPKQSPVIPSEREWDFEPITNNSKEEKKELGFFDETSYHPYPSYLGSNNWVVGPEKSATGNPILCNDPHLNLTLPSIWYENHIHTPKEHVYGVSLPGAPGVIIGFNEYIAWGQTNVGQDVLDWYEIKWTDEKKQTYVLDDEILDAEIVLEKIKVKGQDDIIDTVKWTHWGPVWTKAEKDLAAKWIIHKDMKSNLFLTFIQLNSAKNYEDYKSALKNFDAPAQNFAFAAKDGDIALHPQGKFPIRYVGGGMTIKDGSKKSSDWQGLMPFDHQPSIHNPKQAYVASANQNTTDLTYPYFHHGGFDDYRGRILNRYLQSDSSITIDDCKSFQLSNRSILAEEMMPLILKYIDQNALDEKSKEVFQKLSSWDYTFVATGKEGTLFSMLKDDIEKSVWDEFKSASSRTYATPETWRLLELMQGDPQHKYFDIESTSKKESLSDIVNGTFLKICKEYESYDEVEQWYQYKNTSIDHLARIPAFSKSVKTGGYKQALNAQSAKHGPSWRMIVELGDEVKAYGVYPGGQSGNPGSPYYDDMIDEWAEGKYFPLQFEPNPEAIKDPLFIYNFN